MLYFSCNHVQNIWQKMLNPPFYVNPSNNKRAQDVGLKLIMAWQIVDKRESDKPGRHWYGLSVSDRQQSEGRLGGRTPPQKLSRHRQ